MQSNLPRSVSESELATFERDGVVKLAGMFSQEWIDRLSAGLEQNVATPSARARVWDRDAEGRTMFWDSQAWQQIPEYEEFVHRSPAAELAATLMRSSIATFFFDAVFVRSPGTQFSTPWHQDEPYWSIDGFNTCSIWMPLVPVAAANALSFIPGSHLGNKKYLQHNFAEFDADNLGNADHVDFASEDVVELPDIDSDPASHGATSWDLEPGDCVAFNSRILHGGSGKLPDDVGLSVFTTKWLGEDVVIKFRETGMDPDHTAVMKANGLQPGDRPNGALYPTTWPRANADQVLG